MIEMPPIGVWNTGLPLLLLVGLAIIVPRLLVPKDTRSHWQLGLVILISALVLLFAGAVIFAVIYQIRGHEVWNVLLSAPALTTIFFIRLSGFSAMIWLPLLVLIWFGMAQKLEKSRGEEAMRRGQDGLP